MKNIVVTACSSYDINRSRNYFNGLLTLISSLHEYGFDSFECLIVYDLGITDENKRVLNKISKVKIVEYSDYLRKSVYSEYMHPYYHGYKMFSVKDAERYGDNVLWLDCGVCLTSDIKIIFDIIEKDHIFLVWDGHLNYQMTSIECSNSMAATEEELNSNQICSGMLGYKVSGKYQQLIDDSYRYSFNRDCLYSLLDNHRHDQSVYSILASRYNCKL